jgi:hypothetical protein
MLAEVFYKIIIASRPVQIRLKLHDIDYLEPCSGPTAALCLIKYAASFSLDLVNKLILKLYHDKSDRSFF